MNTRRKLIASATAVVMFTLGLAIEGQSQEGRPIKRALEGSWRVSGDLGPNRPPFVPATIEGLATYDAGGGFILSDNQPNLPPAHGSWEYAGHGTFNTTLVKFLLNPQGQLVATLHVRSRITLNSTTRDEWMEEAETEIREFPSGVLLAAYNGVTGVGTRIRVEPIE
jgi:hypothetical protein